MLKMHPNTPVIVGVGQVAEGREYTGEAEPSPSTLRVTAATRALQDCGAPAGLAATIDRVVVVRTMLDSIEGAAQPFGRCSNPPGALARDLGIADAHTVYSTVGGDQPQMLVSEAAELVFRGEAVAVLIAGSEATFAQKMAARARQLLDWSDDNGIADDDRGLGTPLLSPYEVTNGLGPPTVTYPAIEHALRVRLRLNRDAHVALMSELWSGFSKIAAQNPYAWFPEERSAAFLATPAPDNYPIADPYLKWHVAQDSVNQGAALIVTTVGNADALDIPAAKRVYLRGYAQAVDRFVTERADLSRSRSMELAVAHALNSAGKCAAEIDHFDLYSCFPCAVLLATEALDLDWRRCPPTVTGGLPFFGGPGNNYSTHAIAAIAQKLRDDPGTFGLVLANGGYLSKQAVGVYSSIPPDEWQPISSKPIQKVVDAEPVPVLIANDTDAVVESFTVAERKGRPSRAYVIGRAGDRRVLARVRRGHRATMLSLSRSDPVGKAVRVAHVAGANFLEPAGRLGELRPGFPQRQFHHVQVARRDHVLEVTLDRPKSRNALHGDAHYELHEIWDEFERDDDLWAAILTGAGTDAFCSGNDLKVTATGGDVSFPRTGFAGLTARFDREKPIIAAVNGAAFGGGMEIVLACDLAVAAENARFALPEVKVGLLAAAGGVQRLSRQIGRKAAMEMVLTGRTIGADEALALGLVNACVAEGSATAAARDLAAAIVANSPVAVRASKCVLNSLDEIERARDAIALSAPVVAALLRTADFREGVAAFVEKRKPRWTNA